MTNTNGMAHKFCVIKNDDIKKYLSDKERFALNHLQTKIALGRESDDKTNSNEYLVVNTDESYADYIIDILKANGHWGNNNTPKQQLNLTPENEMQERVTSYLEMTTSETKTIVHDDEDKAVTYAQMEQRVDEYIDFNGMDISDEQREQILEYLDGHRDYEEDFDCELVCEIRTMNGD